MCDGRSVGQRWVIAGESSSSSLPSCNSEGAQQEVEKIRKIWRFLRLGASSASAGLLPYLQLVLQSADL